MSGGGPRPGHDRPAGRVFASRSPVLAPTAMVASSQPLATQAALEVLRAGGSAIDAAIACNAVLCVVEPTGAGLGGDLFAQVWDAGRRELTGLNASGRSPRALQLAHFRERGLERVPATGPLSVSVPGAVDGWHCLHRRWGRLPGELLLAPAIDYARRGFPVSEVIAAEWADNARRLGDQPGFAAAFLPAGRAPAAGEIFRNPALAATLELVARGGSAAFYRGPVAEAIDDCMRRHEGFLAAADLAAHVSDWVQPAFADYRGVRVWELPPNTQGFVSLQMLNILAGFDLAGLGPDHPQWLHLLIEAKKLAYADRARHYADPDFASLPLARLLDPGYAAALRGLVDPARALPVAPDACAPAAQGDTVCLSVADADGFMVSLIQSNYHGMGSGVTPEGLGFVLQNRGELFSLAPGHANAYAPGKRPFHTIIPAFVTRNGEPWLAFGVMGADMQPQGHVQVLANLLDFGMNLQEAGDAARLNHVGSPDPVGNPGSGTGIVHLEDGILAACGEALAGRGHQVAPACGIFGGYQAVARDPRSGCWVGASDPRKDGQAAGY